MRHRDYYELFMKYKEVPVSEIDDVLLSIYEQLKDMDEYKDQINFKKEVNGVTYLSLNEGSYFYRDYFMDQANLEFILYQNGDILNRRDDHFSWAHTYNDTGLDFINVLNISAYRHEVDKLTSYLKGYYLNEYHKDKFLDFLVFDISSILTGFMDNFIYMTPTALKLAVIFYRAIVDSFIESSHITDVDIITRFNLKPSTLPIDRSGLLFELELDVSNSSLQDLNKIFFIAARPYDPYINSNNIRGKTIFNIDLDNSSISKEYLQMINIYFKLF